MAPTQSAEQFHAVARRIIDEADAARDLFRKPSTRRHLTLGLMRTLDMNRTISLLKPLTANSEIALRLVGIDQAADARIISKNIAQRRGAFHSALERALCRGAAAVASADAERPASHRRLRRRADDRPLSLRAARILRRAPRRASRQRSRESEDWAMALVAAGVGVAIVPEGVARANPEVAVREIEVDVKRQVGLAYSSTRPPSDALKDFIATLRHRREKQVRAQPASRRER